MCPTFETKYKTGDGLTLFSKGGGYLPPLQDFSIFDRTMVSEGGESVM